MSQDPIAPPPPPTPPAPPAPPAGSGPEGPRLPWEERDRLGFLDALIETVKLIATAPSDAFSRLRSDGDLIWPLVFGLIFSWIGQFLNQVWNLLFGGAMQSMMTGFGDMGDLDQYLTFGSTGALQFALNVILWPIFFLIIIFVGGGIFHGCLMLVGATNESPTGFEGTLKVLCYSQIANLAAIVPLLGGLVATLISLVLLVIGFTQVHRTEQGKALIAVLIPVVLCCLCCIVGILAIGGGLAAMMAGAG